MEGSADAKVGEGPTLVKDVTVTQAKEAMLAKKQRFSIEDLLSSNKVAKQEEDNEDDDDEMIDVEEDDDDDNDGDEQDEEVNHHLIHPFPNVIRPTPVVLSTTAPPSLPTLPVSTSALSTSLPPPPLLQRATSMCGTPPPPPPPPSSTSSAAASAAAAQYHHLLYSQWLATRNSSIFFGLQGERQRGRIKI